MKKKFVLIAITISVAIGMIAIARIARFIVISRPNMDEKSARMEASVLLAKVGGSDKVCSEAAEIFRRNGKINGIKFFFDKSDLSNCPAISALGKVDGIWPDNPRCIKIRVGGHNDGYIIEIIDTNDLSSNFQSVSTNYLLTSCIYVHR